MYLNDIEIPNNRFASEILKSFKRTVRADLNDIEIPNNRFASEILKSFKRTVRADLEEKGELKHA